MIGRRATLHRGFRALTFVVIATLALQACADAKQTVVVVTIGDSITDGGAYVVLFRQAVEEVGKEKLAWVNAGIGGDTAAGVRKRMDRDVFRFKPDRVTFAIGTNDALHGVTPEAYEADVSAILDGLAARKIPVIVLTTPILGPKNAAAEKDRVDAYVEILQRLAKQHGYPVAPVNQLMRDARSAGKNLIEIDGVHPNELGHRIMARALLDATGYQQLSVPDKFKPPPLPGIVREWKLRVIPTGDSGEPMNKLDDHGASNEPWHTYALPQAEPTDQWWTEVERPRGVAFSLQAAIGKGKLFEGTATVESKDARAVYLNTGASLQAVWLNGEAVYRNDGSFKGWHPGRDRISVQLRAGKNEVVIETGDQFFLSFTDALAW